MTGVLQSWRAGLVELRAQWATNPRLRLGVLAIVVIAWVYALLVAADTVDSWRKALAGRREQIARLEPLSREKQWPARAEEARQQWEAMQGMLWRESDIGLAEAAFQDWIRDTAGKARLNVRELTVTRAAGAPAQAAPASSPARGEAAMQVVKARLVVDLNRMPQLGFLSEVAASERVVVVDRLVLHNSGQPATAEIDLRMVAAARAEPAK